MPVNSFKAVLFFAVFSLSGCATLQHMDELLTLKSVADDQKQIEIYLAKQERGFNRLNDDIKNNRLSKGQLKRSVIAKYSEPVLIKKAEPEAGGIKEILLYRHPASYFKSDRIYLYFDDGNRLVSWELKPAEGYGF